MSLRSLLAVETSRANTDFVLDIVLQKPELLQELVALAFQKEEPFSRRAIWVLDICDEQHPELVEPYLDVVAENLSPEGHDAYKRHSLKILARHKIPEAFEVRVFDFCLNMLTGDEATAVKLHAIHILNRYAQAEPGLKHEIIAAIELGIQEGTVGLKNIGEKTLRKLKKLKA